MSSLEFNFRGTRYQLIPHPRDARAGKAGPWYLRLPAWMDPQRPLRRVGPSGSGWETRDSTGRTADQRAIDTATVWLAGGPASPVAVGQRLDALRTEFAAKLSPDQFHASVSAWLSGQRTAAAAVPIGGLMDAYVAAGCPDPHLRPRTGQALYQETRALERSRGYFAERDARTLRVPQDTDAYHEQRTAAARASGRGAGHRAVDNELGSLRNCLGWAVRSSLLAANPLADAARPVPTYHHPADVVHCAAKTVGTDEELHTLLAWLFSRPATAVSGARVAFGALTGLRPGEPTFLQWDQREQPAGLAAPGHRACYRRGDVTGEKLLVAREKGGINPAIEVHAVLADFLAAWRAYCRKHFPESPWMFPDVDRPELPACRRAVVLDYWQALGLERPAGGVTTNSDPLSQHLTAAAKALGLGKVVPHGMRAYYVRVRRSQGVPDSTIGDELGHTGGAKLIVQVYGSPAQVFGLGTLDWLPSAGAPAWQNLNAVGQSVSHPC
jgi:integrase